MPTDKLRPIVRCCTIRYNKNTRLGRGFTPRECAEAVLDYKYARTIGISVDLRRKNTNLEALQANVDRLKEYHSKIKIFESKKEAIEAGAKQHIGTIMPIEKTVPVVPRISTNEVATFN
jgi:large subunit ribosomal protein L13e